MAFGLFRRRLPEPAAPAIEPPAGIPAAMASATLASDSASEILELLELELGAMIRQLERAAGSVAGGAEATAATLSTIRQRTDALTGRTSAAQNTATSFSQAADKFTSRSAFVNPSPSIKNESNPDPLCAFQAAGRFTAIRSTGSFASSGHSSSHFAAAWRAFT